MKFNPLVVPKKLEEKLPFKSKTKDIPKRRKPSLDARRAIIMDPKERKDHAILQKYQLMKHHKVMFKN